MKTADCSKHTDDYENSFLYMLGRLPEGRHEFRVPREIFDAAGDHIRAAYMSGDAFTCDLVHSDYSFKRFEVSFETEERLIIDVHLEVL